MTQQFQYIGILGNVDDSILNVFLPNGFQFGVMPLVKMLEIGEMLTGEPMKTIERQWTSSYRCIIDSQLKNLGQNDRKTTSNLKCYILTKSFEVDVELSEDNRIATVNDWMKLAEPANELTAFEIELLRKLNLFKEGHVCIPVSFNYIQDGSKMVRYGSRRSTSRINTELLSLEAGEDKELEKFIGTTTLPENDSYIGLAFQNYELSYRTENLGLSFITAFIALEVLFDAGAHKVARNLAVLLGRDVDDSKRIFDEVKALHNKRSNIVHSGKMSKITKEDLLALRSYARKSIVRTNNLNIQKTQLIETLNMSGFGVGSDL